MTLDEVLAAIKADDRKDPRRVALGRETPTTADEIAAVERELGVQLPSELQDLLTHLGAGDIGNTWVYGVRLESDPSLIDVNRSALQPLRDFLAFSDNGAGDYFGYEVREDRTLPGIIFLDHETGERERVFDSLADWLADRVSVTGHGHRE